VAVETCVDNVVCEIVDVWFVVGGGCIMDFEFMFDNELFKFDNAELALGNVDCKFNLENCKLRDCCGGDNGKLYGVIVGEFKNGTGGVCINNEFVIVMLLLLLLPTILEEFGEADNKMFLLLE
jgi:hypothetical protein